MDFGTLYIGLARGLHIVGIAGRSKAPLPQIHSLMTRLVR